MTREEAIFCEKSYIGETNCTDCKYYGTETCKSRESHRMAIKALEQEPFINKPCIAQPVCHEDKIKVLDKIRVEIEQKCCITVGKENDPAITLYGVFEIIDKYRAESEVEENG